MSKEYIGTDIGFDMPEVIRWGALVTGMEDIAIVVAMQARVGMDEAQLGARNLR